MTLPILFVLGYFITQTLLLIWFYSPLKITLGQLFIDKNLYTVDQVETAVIIRNKWLGELISCYICCSFWASLGVSLILKNVFSLPSFFVLLAWFSYPSICYLYKILVNKHS
jgi:hypothetical protein